MQRCPGQDQRFWKPDDIFDINCSQCGQVIEVWKDEPRVKCPGCGEVNANPKLDLSCAKWCKYAKQCLGDMGGADPVIVCDKIIAVIEKRYGDDKKLIVDAQKTLEYAEKIQLKEESDPLVVKASALLGGLNSVEIAEEILNRLGIDEEAVEDICRIITKLRGGQKDESKEFGVVFDARKLVSLKGQCEGMTSEKMDDVKGEFMTGAGVEILGKLLREL